MAGSSSIAMTRRRRFVELLDGVGIVNSTGLQKAGMLAHSVFYQYSLAFSIEKAYSMYAIYADELETMHSPIMRPMPYPKGAPDASNSPSQPLQECRSPRTNEDAVSCERCGKAEMYRMHAVWRCPACGYKTDCCGW